MKNHAKLSAATFFSTRPRATHEFSTRSETTRKTPVSGLPLSLASFRSRPQLLHRLGSRHRSTAPPLADHASRRRRAPALTHCSRRRPLPSAVPLLLETVSVWTWRTGLGSPFAGKVRRSLLFARRDLSTPNATLSDGRLVPLSSCRIIRLAEC